MKSKQATHTESHEMVKVDFLCMLAQLPWKQYGSSSENSAEVPYTAAIPPSELKEGP
jgi:hypothetical protein